MPEDDNNLAVKAARLLREPHGDDRRRGPGDPQGHTGRGWHGRWLRGCRRSARRVQRRVGDRACPVRSSRSSPPSSAATCRSCCTVATRSAVAGARRSARCWHAGRTTGSSRWPHEGLSTKAVFAEFDRLNQGSQVQDPVVPDALLAALRAGDAEALGAALSNDLTEAALSLRPELQDTLEIGIEAGALGAILSGSAPPRCSSRPTSSTASTSRSPSAAPPDAPTSCSPAAPSSEPASRADRGDAG